MKQIRLISKTRCLQSIETKAFVHWEKRIFTNGLRSEINVYLFGPMFSKENYEILCVFSTRWSTFSSQVWMSREWRPKSFPMGYSGILGFWGRAMDFTEAILKGGGCKGLNVSIWKWPSIFNSGQKLVTLKHQKGTFLLYTTIKSSLATLSQSSSISTPQKPRNPKTYSIKSSLKARSLNLMNLKKRLFIMISAARSSM